MAEVEVAGVSHRYGRVVALDGVTLEIPAGAVYALLGPNGAGKTTLLQILAGLRTPGSGRARVLGRDVRRLRAPDRARLGYVAEGQRLPDWMTLGELEKWLAPLYPQWDADLASGLRARFRLEPGRRLKTLSRGERMKAVLLCTLAPRPRLLLLDEPFSGMDALVKDELVSGLLDTASSHGATVLIASHDLAELELLADWVGFLDGGRLRLSAAAEALQARFLHFDLMGEAAAAAGALPGRVLAHQRAGSHTRFILDQPEARTEAELRRLLPPDTHGDIRPATLREIFLALATPPPAPADRTEVAA